MVYSSCEALVVKPSCHALGRTKTVQTPLHINGIRVEVEALGNGRELWLRCEGCRLPQGCRVSVVPSTAEDDKFSLTARCVSRVKRSGISALPSLSGDQRKLAAHIKDPKTHKRLKRTLFNQTKQDTVGIFEEILFFQATYNTKANTQFTYLLPVGFENSHPVLFSWI